MKNWQAHPTPLTSATDGVERSAECIFSPREIGDKAGPRADLDPLEKKESTCPSLHWTKIPQTSSHQHSHRIEYSHCKWFAPAVCSLFNDIVSTATVIHGVMAISELFSGRHACRDKANRRRCVETHGYRPGLELGTFRMWMRHVALSFTEICLGNYHPTPQ